jgi:hypothetical protein
MQAQCLIAITDDVQRQSSCGDNIPPLLAKPVRRRAVAVYDRFATIPAIPTIPPRLTLPALPERRSIEEEEKLHTSFEQAISGRLLVVQQQLDRQSGLVTSTRRILPHTESLHELPAPEKRSLSLFTIWQRRIAFAGMACMFLLISYDLMGVLMLFAR